MLFKHVVASALVGLTVANPVVVKDSLYPRSEQDLQAAQDAPAIKGLLTTINSALMEGDKLIQGYTAENAEAQTKKIVVLLKKTGPQLEAVAKKIEASQPISGITSVLGLISPVTALAKTANSTFIHVQANIAVIKASNQSANLVEGVVALKPGVKALVKALPGQISQSTKDSVLKSIPKGSLPEGAQLPTGSSEKQIGELIDQSFDAITAILQGKPLPSFTLPAGMTLPTLPAGATLPSGFPKGGAVGAVPVPKPTGAVGAAPAPKPTGAPRPKASVPKASAPKASVPKPKSPPTKPSQAAMEGMNM